VVRVFSALEKAFVVAVIFLSTGALLSLLHQKGRTVISGAQLVDVAQGDPVTQIVWSGIHMLILVLAVLQWKRIIYVVTADKLLLLLVGIAVVSILWSAAPELTLRRSLALIGTTVFGAYLVARYSTSELLRLLAWALGIAALSSLVFVLALPSYGIYTDLRGEAWGGIYWHKNTLGRTMALSALVFLFLALGGYTRRWVAWPGFGLSVVILLLSESITSLVSFLILLTLLPIYGALRRSHALAMPFYAILVFACGAVVVWLFVGNAEEVLRSVGRDTTLSGRTQLWDAVFRMIAQHPWLGYGYGAFWLGWTGESAQVLLQMLGLGIGANYGAADNGFLDLWLQLGLVGVLAFAFGFVQALLRTVTWARLTDTTEGLWPLALLTYILFYNFSESAILAYNNVLWILYVAAVLSTGVPVAKAGEAGHGGATPGRRVTPTRPQQAPLGPARFRRR
jgi:O-antigen ligase